MTRSRRHLIAGLALSVSVIWVLCAVRRPVLREAKNETKLLAPPVDKEPSRPTNVGALSGKVGSVDGGIVKGARLCAMQISGEVFGSGRTRCAMTGESGTYLLTGLGAGEYDLTVSARGYVPATAARGRTQVVQPGRETADVDFVLTRGGAKLSGSVWDVTGGPISAAHVDIGFGAREGRLFSLDADREGLFAAWLEPGRVTVTASADGYVTRTLDHMVPSDELVIRLTPASSVRGRVLSTTARSVPGVEVRAVCAPCLDAAASLPGLSAADGSFIIQNLSAGSYELLAEGDGVSGSSEQPVIVEMGQAVADVVVTVKHTPSVMGSVVLPDGSPCSKGSVMLGPPNHASIAGETQGDGLAMPGLMAAIDAFGIVRFRSVPSGTYSITVSCAEHVLSSGPTSVVVGSESVRDLSWIVKPGLELTVRVVDEAASPLANTPFWLVPARSADGTLQLGMVYTTDDGGRSRIGGHLTPGTYQLQPYNGYSGDPVSLELKQDMAPFEATLRLKGLGSIEVDVVGRDGAPIDTVHVTAERRDPDLRSQGSDYLGAIQSLGMARDAAALGRGRFKLQALTTGRYELRVEDGVNAAIKRDVEVRTGTARERFVLARGTSLRGEVVDANRQPVSDAWVSVHCTGSQQTDHAEHESESGPAVVLREARRAVTDSQGRFELSGVASDATACSVEAEEPGGSLGRSVAVKPSEHVVVVMQTLGMLAGSLRWSTPGASGPVTLVVANERYVRQRVQELASGTRAWTVDDIPPGPLKLLAYDAHGHSAERSVELAPGERLSDIQLELEATQPMHP